MNISSRSLLFLILLSLPITLLALIQAEDQWVYNDFKGANLSLHEGAILHPNGLLQLTNLSNQQTGHAFYKLPLTFNTSSSRSLSFSTTFVVAIVPELPNIGGHGIAFTISPSMDFSQAMPTEYLGLLNTSNNGLSSNHLFAVELDTVKSPDFEDINGNHVGIDVNSLKSNVSVPVTYVSNSTGGMEKSLELDLMSGCAIQVWIDYDDVEKLVGVSLAPIKSPKPIRPLMSAAIDLSLIFVDSMYVGFSASTGSLASNQYVLGWSFNRKGQAQELDPLKLPSFPRHRKRRGTSLYVTISLIIVSVVLIISAISYIAYVTMKKYEEIREDWEEEYGPQRFSYKDLYKATTGFKETNLLGEGGFGKVYRGVLPCSRKEVAIKKVTHESNQGMKEFVSEIASMGRLRHRNLVQLLGYCRRRGELLLVYDYMPNTSLDKFLFSNEKPNLDWTQRYGIIKGVASALLYLHEEWEQVVIHRDVKASNVLLDADLNGRLGDFGLARFSDHGTNPHTTNVVGTVGYIAPEITRTGKATTITDVFAFGAFMLEVACGRRPVEPQGLPREKILVDWVFESWKQGAILETSDPRLEGDYVVEEMELTLKLGVLCSHSNPVARPSMRQVMQYLNGDVLEEILLESAELGMLRIGGEAPTTLVMSTFTESDLYPVPQPLSINESILSRGR